MSLFVPPVRFRSLESFLKFEIQQQFFDLVVRLDIEQHSRTVTVLRDVQRLVLGHLEHLGCVSHLGDGYYLGHGLSMDYIVYETL